MTTRAPAIVIAVAIGELAEAAQKLQAATTDDSRREHARTAAIHATRVALLVGVDIAKHPSGETPLENEITRLRWDMEWVPRRELNPWTLGTVLFVGLGAFVLACYGAYCLVRGVL